MTKQNNTPLIILILVAAFIIVTMISVVSGEPLQLNFPRVNVPDGEWHMQQVMPMPSFIHKIDARAVPGPDTEIFFDPQDMPPIPDCQALNFEECRWEAHFLESPGGDMVQVELRARGGKVLGRAEMLKVQTSEFDELYMLRRMGYNEGWIARIEVMNVFRGNGLGRTMWRAGDIILKGISGGGVLRIFNDQAGWGNAIMKLVPQDLIVISQSPIWAYIID